MAASRLTCSSTWWLCQKAAVDTSWSQTPVSLLVKHCSEASKPVLGYLGISSYHNTSGQEATWAITKVRVQAHLETLQTASVLEWATVPHAFRAPRENSAPYWQAIFLWRCLHPHPATGIPPSLGILCPQLLGLSDLLADVMVFCHWETSFRWICFQSVSSFDLLTSVELQEGIIYNHHISITSYQHLQYSFNKTFWSP